VCWADTGRGGAGVGGGLYTLPGNDGLDGLKRRSKIKKTMNNTNTIPYLLVMESE